MSGATTLNDRRAAWLLALLEFFFALGWVVYVVFLPELLARAGVDRRYLPWILALDQLVFAVADWAMGVAVDRARAALRRFGPLLVVLTGLSALAMLLLPWLAEVPVAFLALTSVWVATSSALRAPPYVLLSRYAARAALPRLAAIQLLGLAAASALAPYLTIMLKGIDPVLPFLSSAAAVACAAWALVVVERGQPATAVASTGRVAPSSSAGGQWWVLLSIALLLGCGQQVHTAINSAALFRRFADPALLAWLLPVFWVGFSLGLLFVGRIVSARGALPVVQLASVAGALVLAATVFTASLPVLVATELIAGALWGLVLCAAIGLAAERGDPLRTGRSTGALMATLAVAAMSRLSLTAAGGAAELGTLVEWLPAVAWAAAAGLLLQLRSR